MSKLEVTYFPSAGPENTSEALQIAKAYAENNKIQDIICASTSGSTALKLIELFDPNKFNLIVVTHADGFQKVGYQEFLPENRVKIEGKAKILTGIHAFSGISRAFRKEMKVHTPIEIIARMLRSVFGDGLKVCVEITLMAADAGLITCEKEKNIVAIAGTGRGVDTVAVIRPAYTTNFLNLRISQILCKPMRW
ncbi:MAG: pyruvate kinase alpha/beta domain-containing protein [Candidatus Helarchaeota archaeon]